MNKYSLKENLFYGRGLNLLSEASPSVPRTIVPSITITVNGTSLNPSDFLKIKTAQDVYSKLPTHNGTGWRTQKKVAAWLIGEGFELKWIASGSAQPDVLVEKNGILYSFEVGNKLKVTQLGNMHSNHALARTSKTSPDTIEKQRKIGASKLRGTTAGTHRDFLDTEKDRSFEVEEISLGQTGSYWKSDQSDILVMIEENGNDALDPNCTISMIALSEEGNDLSQAERWGLQTYANMINREYTDHRESGKDGDIQRSNTRGGSWKNASGSGRRAGFEAFAGGIADSMKKVN